KTTRNAMIGFVVLGYALYWARKGQAQQVEGKAAFLWHKFPKFILGSDGSFYGETYGGGSSGCNGFGCGVIFEITP
ncbi:MAG: hypothetical protein ACLPPV_20280, partial [Candidatus Korobacteraceae bacterium]